MTDTSVHFLEDYESNFNEATQVLLSGLSLSAVSGVALIHLS